MIERRQSNPATPPLDALAFLDKLGASVDGPTANERRRWLESPKWHAFDERLERPLPARPPKPRDLLRRQRRHTSERLQPRLLRTNDAAEYLGASPWHLWRLVKAGRLPFVQHNPRGPWWFDIHDLDRYIEEQKQTFSL